MTVAYLPLPLAEKGQLHHTAESTDALWEVFPAPVHCGPLRKAWVTYCQARCPPPCPERTNYIVCLPPKSRREAHTHTHTRNKNIRWGGGEVVHTIDCLTVVEASRLIGFAAVLFALRRQRIQRWFCLKTYLNGVWRDLRTWWWFVSDWNAKYRQCTVANFLFDDSSMR